MYSVSRSPILHPCCPDTLPHRRLSLSALLGEASFTAALCEELWLPSPPRPGLCEAESAHFGRAHVERLRALVDEIRASKRDRGLAETAANRALRARARERLGDVSAALRIAATGSPVVARNLATIRAQHADRSTGAHALAHALEDHASLAEMHRDALDGLALFDVAWIDDARAIAKELRAVPSRFRDARAEARAATRAREALAAELQELLSRVRTIARVVYRKHPEVARHFASATARARASKRRKAGDASTIV